MKRWAIWSFAIVAAVVVGIGAWLYDRREPPIGEDFEPPSGPKLVAMSVTEVEAATEALIDGRPTPIYDFELRRYRFRDCERVALRKFLESPLPPSEMPAPKSRAPRSTMVAALRWIEPGAHAEMLPRLRELLSNVNPEIRRPAAQHLASFGNDEVADETAALAGTEVAMVANAALEGIRNAARAQRMTPVFRTRLYPVVRELCERASPSYLHHEKLETYLLWLDPESGAPFLQERIAGATSNAAAALEAFVKVRHPLDASVALKIVDQYRPGNDTKEGNWRARTYGSALKILAQQKHPRTRALIDAILAEPASSDERRILRHENERHDRVEAAAEALCILEDFDLEKLRPKLGHRIDFFPRRELTQVERDLDTMLDAEVANGGFGQYFDNSSGARWRQDLAMLKRIDAPELARILKRAISAFGWSGPAIDREAREQQMENLSERAAATLNSCDDLWYQATESFDAKQLLFTLKHRQLLESLPDPFPHPHPDAAP